MPRDFAEQAAWLELDGVNYRANVWLNGEKLASAEELVGTFAAREWNVSSRLRIGKPNALAIEVFPPNLKQDLAITWVDWNPAPPDRNMGLWRGVYLERSGPVRLRDTHVLTRVDTASLASAELTLKTELSNLTERALRATVTAKLGELTLEQDVELAPGEHRSLVFGVDQHPELLLERPRLWWPVGLGEPDLYELSLSATLDGRVSDSERIQFGIRDVRFDLDAEGHRLFHINGKRFLIRGGGWAPDLLLRSSSARLDAELAFVKDLGLNAIRLEGKLETDDFFDRADRLGIVTLPGWMCCDRWQESKSWSGSERAIAMASMATQARRLRNHPSVVDFMIGSDEAPVPEVEREFIAELERADWQAAISPSASDRKTPLLGKSGVKMTTRGTAAHSASTPRPDRAPLSPSSRACALGSRPTSSKRSGPSRTPSSIMPVATSFRAFRSSTARSRRGTASHGASRTTSKKRSS